MKHESNLSDEVTPLNSIRVETALSRFPVHRLARRGNIEINIQEKKDSTVQTHWEVDYSRKHGQPGPLAYKLDTLIINRRIEETKRPVARLIRLGSLKEICRELGMSENGGNTNQIKKSLFQNALAGITAKTSYSDTDGTNRTLEAVFTRYSVILTGERLPDGRKADAVYILLNEIFMQVINGAVTRPLDYDYLRILSPASQRFYELLSYQMYAALKYDRPRAKLIYSNFCSHAPQTRHTDWERVRSQMNKIHSPHKKSGYIDHIDFQQSIDHDGLPDWIMHYRPGPKAQAEFRAFARRGGPTTLEIESPNLPPRLKIPRETELEGELIRRGITPAMAAVLVQDHTEDRIRAQIERLEWTCEKRPTKVSDPAAYLVGAIRDNYAAPKGFVSQAERQRLQEAKQAKDRQAAEDRRHKEHSESLERARQQRDAAYWGSLTAEQQAELQANADADVDPAQLASEAGPLKRIGRNIRRVAYIRAMLDERDKSSGKG